MKNKWQGGNEEVWGDNYKNNSEILSRLQVILSAGSDSASPSNPNCDKNL